MNDFDENCFVYADYVKPTLRLEWLSFIHEKHLENNFKLFFPQVRKEEITPFVKHVTHERTFVEKYANVFADWKSDTLDMYTKMA